MRDQQQSGYSGRVQKTLDRSCDYIDENTLLRLSRIRQQVLAADTRPPILRWWPLGSALAALALVVLVVLPSGTAEDGLSQLESPDLEILATGEALELYEDYEFYQWLSSYDDH